MSKRLEELNKELEKLNKELEESKKEVSSEINNKIKDLENKGLEGLERLSEDDDLKLDNVLTVYRSLRDNHDYYLKYEDSGRFFVNEMRLKRRFIGKASSGRGIRKKLSNAVERLIMLFYEAVSLYGESYVRPILFMFACIFTFSILRLCENWPIPLHVGLRWDDLQLLLEELKRSIYAFFQLYWDEKPLTFIERAVSPPILGTLYISLKRRLERRIRH
ncbi:MAG: hypothetical protein FGF50_11470 [Candidatus Brockarchaeota archaeon]|nr:hypothetical protein [Candidatus Brockarchaeota archaeon]